MLVLGWVTACEYMVLQAFFWPFLAIDFFCRHLQKNYHHFGHFEQKKIWPPGGLEQGTFGLGDRRLISLATQS